MVVKYLFGGFMCVTACLYISPPVAFKLKLDYSIFVWMGKQGHFAV